MSYLRHRTQNAFERFLRAGFGGKLAFVFSSALGAGLFPFAQGTVGTLAGIPLVILLAHRRPLVGALVILILILLAVWSSHVTCRLLANEDPAEVVIDEVAGILITFFLVPFSWLYLCFGFVLFRVFDILKPYPGRRLEKLEGGLGIVADDLMAGLYANVCLSILAQFIGP
jgi:phosphatidylglycerophosphatase A